MADKSDKSRVVAYEYDNATTGSEAPVSFGVVPGIWTPGEAMLPEAFGMTVEQMRDAIREYNLPLREVRVAEGKAVAEVDKGFNHLPVETGSVGAPAQASEARLETKEGPIPAPAPAGVHRPLLPLAAAMQARNTVLAEGGSLEAAAAAARAAGGEWGEGIAEAAEAAHRDAETLQEAQEEQVASGELVEPEESA
jgi:hypothetical protein